MDPRPASGGLAARPQPPSTSGEGGFASLEFVVAAALAMVFVAGLVQVVAYQYTKGAVIAGLERAVRAGAVVGAGEAQCRVVLADSLNEVLGGAVGGSLASDCTADGETIRAHASGVVPSWLAGPDLGFDLEVVARRELGP